MDHPWNIPRFGWIVPLTSIHHVVDRCRDAERHGQSASSLRRRPPAPGPSSFSVTGRADNALIADAMVALSSPAEVYVEYGQEALGWLRTAPAPAADEHAIPLFRLRENAAYEARAFVLDESRCPLLVARSAFSTGSIPGLGSKLIVDQRGRSSTPLTLMDLRDADNDDRWILFLDRDARPVWYYQLPRQVIRAAAGRGVNGLIRLRNGNLLYLSRNFGLEEVTPDSRLARRVRMLDAQVHHDLLQMPDGRILVLGAEERAIDDGPNGGTPDFRVRGDTIIEVDLEQDSEREIWSAFDSLDPLLRAPHWEYRKEDGAQEWTHGNSLFLGARGNLLVSFRHLDQIISLAPDLQSIDWKLGGRDSTFSFPDESDRFFGQHSVSELENGHLHLFDNGNFRPSGEFSRALELTLDFEATVARKSWEYRHQPDLFEPSQSNAVRLGNGGTLVNFGFLSDPTDPVVVVESAPDGSETWELAIWLKGQRTNRYRVYPAESIAGETVVEPTSLLIE